MGQASFELTQGVKRPAALRLLSDDRLARRAAEGDRGAFAVIFERHHQGLYRYCRAILRHDEDARDALQTTFTRAIAALDGDERAVTIKPWLYRIAHNEAISLLRRRRPLDSIDGQPDLASQSPGPDDRVLASERMRQLLADLEQLPERQRSALLLRELNDLTYADIASAITTTEQAARQSVYEARVMLMELKEGREMPCSEVRRLVSERDGRLLRPRKVRAHLRACESCAGFRASIGARRADLGALAPPLPAAAAAALLNALLGGGGGGWGGGGLVAALGAGKGAVAAVGSKGLATAAALTIAGGALVTTTGTIPPAGRGEREGTKPAALEARGTPGTASAPASTLPTSVRATIEDRPSPYAVDTHATTRATQPATPHEQTLEAPLAAPAPVAPREHAPAPAPTDGSVPSAPAGQVAPQSAEQGTGPAQQGGGDDEPGSGDEDSRAGRGDNGAGPAGRDEDSARGASHENRGSKANDEDPGASAYASSTRSGQARTAALQSRDDAGRDGAASGMRRRDDRDEAGRGTDDERGHAARGSERDDRERDRDDRGDGEDDSRGSNDARGNSDAKGKNDGRDDEPHGNAGSDSERDDNSRGDEQRGNARTTGRDDDQRGNAGQRKDAGPNAEARSTDQRGNGGAGRENEPRGNADAGRGDEPRGNGDGDARNTDRNDAERGNAARKDDADDDAGQSSGDRTGSRGGDESQRAATRDGGGAQDSRASGASNSRGLSAESRGKDDTSGGASDAKPAKSPR